MAHIIPHWNWPEREGEITPVHVFTSGDEAELFLKGKSLGVRKKGENQYRLRWDDVVYRPGKLEVLAYKDGSKWAVDSVVTTQSPAKLKLEADRKQITADGKDLSFLTLRVVDANELTVSIADNLIEFGISGPGEIVATDNGDPSDMTPFVSSKRDALNGLALVIVRGKKENPGEIKVKAKSDGLGTAEIIIESK